MEQTAASVGYEPHVGDLVRVAPPADSDACEECPHFPGEEGQTGRIVHSARGSRNRSHPYLVLFSSPCTVESRHAGPLEIRARHYAASELVPVVPPT